MSEAIPIEVAGAPAPPVPRLRGHVVMRKDGDGAIDALLADLYLHAQNCVRAFGDFHLGVAGARELEPVLMRLMFDLGYREFPWARTRVWMLEELCVAPEDPRRVGPWLREIIVEASGIPVEQFHAIDPESPPAAYEATLREHLGWRPKGQDRLDLVLLALRDGGGVALAGPADAPEHCASVPGAEPGAIALSRSVVNAARLTCVLASGERLRSTVGALCAEYRRPAADRAGLAALGLRPVGDGELRWYVDHEAAGEGARSKE